LFSVSRTTSSFALFVLNCEEVRRSFVAESPELCEPNWASKLGSLLPRVLGGVLGKGEPSVICGGSVMVGNRAMG
jgi:hypothetical protein